MYIPAGPVPIEHLVAALLVWAAYLWTREIYDRFPADLEELANSDDTIARGVIVFYWLATLAFLALAAWRVYVSASMIINSLR